VFLSGSGWKGGVGKPDNLTPSVIAWEYLSQKGNREAGASLDLHWPSWLFSFLLLILDDLIGVKTEMMDF